MSQILISALAISLLYLVYRCIYIKETNFRQLRWYLLFSLVIAVLLPFSKYSFEVDLLRQVSNIPAIAAVDKEVYADLPEATHAISNHSVENTEEWLDIQLIINIILNLYFVVVILLILRIVIQLIMLLVSIYTSHKQEGEGITIVFSEKYKVPFSFFRYVIIPKTFTDSDDLHQVIEHEKIHVFQYHSIDLILFELLTAVMWFNPLVWMMKKSVQLVHEYLADEGALGTGIDRLKYQALLLNQVTEERLICLSSNFNHSLIKKRMIMMTKQKFNHKTKLKILALLPMAAILFFGVACINGQQNRELITAVAPTRMNVLYLEAENPISIASSGIEASQLTAEIDNGTITGKNGNYIVKPDHPGTATITVFSDGKEIEKSVFRVKIVPDPIAKIAGKYSGEISKAELLSAGGMTIELENFDFDVKFEVASYVMSATKPNSLTVIEEVSNSAGFSDAQLQLINSLIVNQKLVIEEIRAIAPGGKKMKIRPMVFTIAE